MPDKTAVPETQSDKKQGDKLDDVLGKGTGLAQDPSKDEKSRTPADQPLK